MTDPDAGRPELGPNSLIAFFDLSMRPDGEDVIVGRVETGDFVALPAVGADVITQLRDGRSVIEVERRFAEQDVELDVADFVNQLVELGFVRSVDGAPNALAPTVRNPSLARLQAHHVRWLFTRLAYALYLGIGIGAVVALAMTSRVRPHYDDMFFSASTSVVLAGSTLLFLVIVAFHETAHLVAARASGVPARISLGTRLYSLVVQTDVSGVWSASRRERLRTYLAGMGLDLVLASLLILLRSVRAVDDTFDRILAAAVVLIIVGIAGQFQLYMRTDMYFVVADLLHARNLFEDATVYLVGRLRSLFRSRKEGDYEDPLSPLSPRERRVVRFYAWFMILGTACALAVFAVYLLPALIVLFIHAIHHLVTGIGDRDVGWALDGGATLLIEGGTQLLVVFLIARSRTRWLRNLRSRLSPIGPSDEEVL